MPTSNRNRTYATTCLWRTRKLNHVVCAGFTHVRGHTRGDNSTQTTFNSLMCSNDYDSRFSNYYFILKYISTYIVARSLFTQPRNEESAIFHCPNRTVHWSTDKRHKCAPYMIVYPKIICSGLVDNHAHLT